MNTKNYSQKLPFQYGGQMTDFLSLIEKPLPPQKKNEIWMIIAGHEYINIAEIIILYSGGI